jgi:two-component sensor histidine kinase
VREIQHRSKNMLAVVQSIANFAFDAHTDPARAKADFSGRIAALAASTDLLFLKRGVEIDTRRLVERVIEPHRRRDADQFEITGSGELIPGAAGVTFSMALHELCTNALKYGALSVPEGRVRISWKTTGDELILDWEEAGGPPVAPPEKSGFGSMLLRGLTRRESGLIEFRPQGLYARLVLPLE